MYKIQDEVLKLFYNLFPYLLYFGLVVYIMEDGFKQLEDFKAQIQVFSIATFGIAFLIFILSILQRK